MTADLVRLRWCLCRPGGSRFRVCEEIVNGPVTSLRPILEAAGSVESFYVSKQGGYEVWLTVFAEAHGAVDLIGRVETELATVASRGDHSADSSKEALLLDRCASFRNCIGTMTRVALDLHDPAELVDNQKALITIGCENRADQAQIGSLLERKSRTYSTVDQSAFWNGFASNCLVEQNTDCGHWLYNVVLGCDWFEGRKKEDVAAYLEVPWP